MLTTTLMVFLLAILRLPICLTYGSSDETREMFLMLDENGRLNDSSKIPKCDKHQHIALISYNYHKRECHYICKSSHFEPLREQEQVLLHEMCSMRASCRNLSFPLRTNSQKRTTNYVFLKYKCLDDADTFVYFCQVKQTFISRPTYVAWNSTSGYFNECSCFVNHGNFAVSIKDLRLKDKQRNSCSSASLRINNEDFICDSETDNFGSVFNRPAGDPMENAFIAIKTRSLVDSPDMVVIILTPAGSARIDCKGSTTKVTTDQSESILPKDNKPQDQGRTSDTTGSEADTESLKGLLIANLCCNLLCIIIIVLVSAFTLWQFNRRIKKDDKCEEIKDGLQNLPDDPQSYTMGFENQANESHTTHQSEGNSGISERLGRPIQAAHTTSKPIFDEKSSSREDEKLLDNEEAKDDKFEDDEPISMGKTEKDKNDD